MLCNKPATNHSKKPHTFPLDYAISSKPCVYESASPHTAPSASQYSSLPLAVGVSAPRCSPSFFPIGSKEIASLAHVQPYSLLNPRLKVDRSPKCQLREVTWNNTHASTSTLLWGSTALHLKSGEKLGEIEQSSESPQEESGWKDDLCHAICVNNWSDKKAILDQHPNAMTAEILDTDRTALHVAAMFGNITIVKKLVELLPREFLLTVDSNGYTALAMACWNSGDTQIAKCLINKNSDIVTIPDKNDTLPVSLAFTNDFKEMGRYLYSVTPLECFTGRPGSKLLRFCFQAQCFDIALNLLQQREELLFVPNDIAMKNTPIHQIATLNTVILSPSELIFWK